MELARCLQCVGSGSPRLSLCFHCPAAGHTRSRTQSVCGGGCGAKRNCNGKYSTQLALEQLRSDYRLYEEPKMANTSEGSLLYTSVGQASASYHQPRLLRHPAPARFPEEAQFISNEPNIFVENPLHLSGGCVAPCLSPDGVVSDV
ncbi:hypothetical protein Q5P01_023907 [Channa striata]|uniref:Uncharacterized protein n=1 Tax=Channa striata TaxID=64152 RepID=A0AA88J6X8_CHASR|nr:hypothetical protein Q5P01_023907 [Channa striata]